MSRIFSRSNHDLDEPEDESYGPSPRKPQAQGGFLPLFHGDSSSIPGVTRSPPTEAPAVPATELVPATQIGSSLESGASQDSPAASGPTDRMVPSVGTQQPAPTVVDVDGDAKIHVLPYSRYESSRLADPDDWGEDALALPRTELDRFEAPTEHVIGADRLSHMESMTLTSPQKHAQRALQERRARKDEMVQDLVGHAEPPAAALGIARTGRSGLDADEDVPSHIENSDEDDDWASEASSADYGLGDGGMDETDVV